MVRALDKYIGKEVFIVVDGEDEEDSDINVLENIEDLTTHLMSLNIIIDSDTRVIHGILTSGEFLPSNLHKKSAYIICLNPNNDSSGFVSESGCADSSELAQEIETLVFHGFPATGMDISMDNIYILYGYQLETYISINMEEIDSEAIDTCKKISDEVESVEMGFDLGPASWRDDI